MVTSSLAFLVWLMMLIALVLARLPDNKGGYRGKEISESIRREIKRRWRTMEYTPTPSEIRRAENKSISNLPLLQRILRALRSKEQEEEENAMTG
jgi:hypothetical protein